jgi:hypothetical protein
MLCEVVQIGFMKRLIAIAGAGLALAACSHQDSTGYTAADNSRTSTNALEQSSQSTTERAGPDTAVGAPVAANSGAGTATAQGAAANQSAANEAAAKAGKSAGENQNLNGSPAIPPAGTGVKNGQVNTNGAGHAGSGTAAQQPQ